MWSSFISLWRAGTRTSASLLRSAQYRHTVSGSKPAGSPSCSPNRGMSLRTRLQDRFRSHPVTLRASTKYPEKHDEKYSGRWALAFLATRWRSRPGRRQQAHTRWRGSFRGSVITPRMAKTIDRRRTAMASGGRGTTALLGIPFRRDNGCRAKVAERRWRLSPANDTKALYVSAGARATTPRTSIDSLRAPLRPRRDDINVCFPDPGHDRSCFINEPDRATGAKFAHFSTLPVLNRARRANSERRAL
jgi:hypothetical protein